MSGTLYVVPTPIGNLEDITLRALRVLREVDSVVCEDTRRTAQLLNYYQVRKPLISFFTYNQVRRLPEIIRGLREGKNLALVSDSGTPGISDPGFFLIAEALSQGIHVVPLPGPNAAVTALVGSGLPMDGFVFTGFLKRKAGKLKRELKKAASAGKTLVFYESPHRIEKTLSLCEEVFPPQTQTVVARELTKKFEEFIRGTLKDVSATLRARGVLGECVVLISPPEDGEKAAAAEE